MGRSANLPHYAALGTTARRLSTQHVGGDPPRVFVLRATLLPSTVEDTQRVPEPCLAAMWSSMAMAAPGTNSDSRSRRGIFGESRDLGACREHAPGSRVSSRRPPSRSSSRRWHKSEPLPRLSPTLARARLSSLAGEAAARFVVRAAGSETPPRPQPRPAPRPLMCIERRGTRGGLRRSRSECRSSRCNSSRAAGGIPGEGVPRKSQRAARHKRLPARRSRRLLALDPERPGLRPAEQVVARAGGDRACDGPLRVGAVRHGARVARAAAPPLVGATCPPPLAVLELRR